MGSPRSDALLSKLTERIIGEGPISFRTFMDWALYDLELGYYQQEDGIWGQSGDYVTSPSLSPWFGVCLAHHLKAFLNDGGFSIIEYGPGAGQLCSDVLNTLARIGCQPRQYLWSECSARSQSRLEATASRLSEGVTAKLALLDEGGLSSLPDEPVVILANEYLDALPVHSLLEEEGEVYERCVAVEDGKLAWARRQCEDAALLSHWRRCKQPGWPDSYVSEINLGIEAWFEELGGLGDRPCYGLVIDYGLARREYYHPDRSAGTLRAFRKHTLSEDVLDAPGDQDITAHVDFTHVAEAAVDKGWQVNTYATQQGWLMGPWFLPACEYAQAFLPDCSWQQDVKMLTMPQHMGEIFKVMQISRHWPEAATLMGYGVADQRRLLAL